MFYCEKCGDGDCCERTDIEGELVLCDKDYDLERRNKMTRPDGAKSARVIQVIEVKGKRGLGTEKDPVREVTQYWDLEGNFLAEMDTEHLAPLVEHDARAIKESISC